MNDSMVSVATSRRLYEIACKLVSGVGDDVANSFVTDLPGVDGLEAREVPVSDHVSVAALGDLGTAAPGTDTLVAEVVGSASQQAWRQPYEPGDFGPDFWKRSSWFPIADREGPLVLADGLVEIMLLGSGLQYPTHSHAPEELYVVLAGSVWWEAEGDPEAPCWRSAGEVIHHPPYRRHSLTAGDEAVLILSMWRGGGFEKPDIT